MAKLVGINAQGQIVQAAAGSPEELTKGSVGVIALSTAVGGWFLGSILASSKSGDLFETDPIFKEATAFEEWITFVGAIGGLSITAKMSKEAVDEYGLENVALFSAGLISFVYAGRKLRGF